MTKYVSENISGKNLPFKPMKNLLSSSYRKGDVLFFNNFQGYIEICGV